MLEKQRGGEFYAGAFAARNQRSALMPGNFAGYSEDGQPMTYSAVYGNDPSSYGENGGGDAAIPGLSQTNAPQVAAMGGFAGSEGGDLRHHPDAQVGANYPGGGYVPSGPGGPAPEEPRYDGSSQGGEFIGPVPPSVT